MRLRHSAHLLTSYIYPLLFLCSFAPQNVVTNLLILLSYSLLLVAVWWLPFSCRYLFHCREFRMFIRIVRNVIFLCILKTRDLWLLEPNVSRLQSGAP
jgi:hypothetical protein